MRGQIIFEGSIEDVEIAKEILNQYGFKSPFKISILSKEKHIKIRNENVIRDEIECELVEQYLKQSKPGNLGYKRMTATQICAFLEDKSKKILNLNYIGSALKKCEIYKKMLRIGGEPVFGYEVEIIEDLSREARWKLAQENDYTRYGIAAIDYSNPDDFNAAVREKLKT